MAITVNKPALRRSLLSDAHNGVDRMVASLSVTCKTHKPNGKVELRPIHSSCSHPCQPGMRWMNHLLKAKLDELPHLLQNAESLMAQLRSVSFPLGIRCLKLDIKDFYLTGSHNVLIERSASLLDAEDRDDYRLLAEAVLSNQYIVSGISSNIYKVVKGYGDGHDPGRVN